MDKNSTEVISFLKKFKEFVGERVSLDKFILFGSRARGNNRADSDVDIILISSDFEGKKSFQRSPEFYFNWNYPLSVDIICLTPKEAKSKNKESSIIKQAMREGIII